MMNILEVKDLSTYFSVPGALSTPGVLIKAVRDVSFNIEKGKVFGIVGESGSGKTLTALSILKLVSSQGKIVGGSALFDGLDLLTLDEKILRGIRGYKISIVFQEPASSFNPVFTIGEQITETIINHRRVDAGKARSLTLEYLNRAHIHDEKRIFHSYPHQLSGGTKQRAMIAMAMVNSPQLVILDEPTTALDVTIQAQILDLLKEIIEREKLSILFISHDFGIISRMCDHVAVMQRGSIVETGDTRRVLNDPQDPYTISLLESVKALS
ncbi:MAG: ABC transporter ATP-binding protein [Candidatus Omnitrophota bacterium]|nr:ABC transporter ATP-binding protein [Candidatus Omnitrophota bacterium]